MSMVSEYLDLVLKALNALPQETIQDIIDTLKWAHRDGRQVFLLGNGGSGANASHIAEDLQKGVKEATGKPFKVLALTDSVPIITAWANDSSYDNVFVEQLETFVQPGDVVIALSGSGNSPNVLKAVDLANRVGAITIGWSGMGGGKLADLAQKSIVVESDNMQRIEDVHLVIGHLIFACLMKG